MTEREIRCYEQMLAMYDDIAKDYELTAKHASEMAKQIRQISSNGKEYLELKRKGY